MCPSSCRSPQFARSRAAGGASPRRAVLVVALMLASGAAGAAEADSEADADEAAETSDNACHIARVDPRLDELRQADPTDERINVTSDTGELGRQGDAKLSGNVTIRTGQRLLKADEAELDSTRRSIQLKGRMEFLDPQMHVTGSSGSFVEGGVGEFKGAQFELIERSVRGAAEGARVQPDGRIELEGVRYTACPPGDDDWNLEAGQIVIDQESQMGTGRDVKLEFLGMPIFYTPWITFPVGDQPKSGLLFPTIGSSSKNGTLIAVPYYWHLAPNYDTTLTTRWYSSRGFRLDPQFRYLGERSRSELDVEYMFHDDRRDDARNYVSWRHVTRYAPRTKLTIDAANVSDTDYFEDFGIGYEGTSVTFLNRDLELRHDVGAWSFSARAQGYQVIDQELPDDDTPYQVLPQLRAHGEWRNLGHGFSGALWAEATNFASDFGPQGVRVDVAPTLDWRADRGSAYVAANAGYRYTEYALSDVASGADDSPTRAVPFGSIDTGLVLERGAGARNNRVQTLEPRLLYLYVPYRNQDDLPVFDTGIPDLNMVQLFRDNRYVGPDRVGDANQVSVGVTTRLLDATRGRQYLSATLGQAYYFEDPKVTLPDEPASDRTLSDVIAELELAAFNHWNARFAYQWNPDEKQGERSEVFLQYAPAPARVLNAGYRFRRGSVEQVDFSGAWPINREWRAFARWVYSLQEDKTLDRFVGFEYSSCCWALRLVSRRFVSDRTGDAETSFGIQLELKGLSSVGVDNEAFLSDAIRGYSAFGPAPSS